MACTQAAMCMCTGNEACGPGVLWLMAASAATVPLHFQSLPDATVPGGMVLSGRGAPWATVWTMALAVEGWWIRVACVDRAGRRDRREGQGSRQLTLSQLVYGRAGFADIMGARQFFSVCPFPHSASRAAAVAMGGRCRQPGRLQDRQAGCTRGCRCG